MAAPRKYPDELRERAGAGARGRAITKVGLDLGGNHIDALLAEHAAAEARLPHGDPVTYNRVFRRLLLAAETAKVELTQAEHAEISTPTR